MIDRKLTHLQGNTRSEEHTSELQSQSNLVCRLLLEKKAPPRSAGVRPARASRARSLSSRRGGGGAGRARPPLAGARSRRRGPLAGSPGRSRERASRAPRRRPSVAPSRPARRGRGRAGRARHEGSAGPARLAVRAVARRDRAPARPREGGRALSGAVTPGRPRGGDSGPRRRSRTRTAGAVVAVCAADPRRIGEAGDARRSGGALRLRRSDRRRLPACRAWAGQLPLAREPPGALRDHPRARGGLARRCSPRGADRPRVRSAIAERVTPRTAARRGRARAGRHPIVRGWGGDQGGVRARTWRGKSGGGARAADRRTRWVDPGAARGGGAVVHVRARVRPRRELADGAAGPSPPRRIQDGASGRSRALSPLGRAAARRIRDNLVAPRGAAGALTLTLP